MRKHLNAFIAYREPGPEVSPEGGLKGMMEATGYAPIDLELEEKLGQSLAELNLSVRATNCLESEGINTVRDLVSRSEDQLLQVSKFRRNYARRSSRTAWSYWAATRDESSSAEPWIVVVKLLVFCSHCVFCSDA